MKKRNRNTTLLMLAALLAVALAAAPSFAGMGGGSGGGSGPGDGGSMGGGSSMGGSSSMGGEGSSGGSGAMDQENRAGSRMMDSGNRHVDFGSMPAITTGGLGSGDMTMEIRPVRYSDGRLEVKFFANTHSVSLGRYDLMELSTLEMGGKTYNPVSADKMRGHHAGGRIVFELPEEPEEFSIVIHGIPQMEKRTYNWN